MMISGFKGCSQYFPGKTGDVDMYKVEKTPNYCRLACIDHCIRLPEDGKVNEFMVKNTATHETESYVERTFELSLANKDESLTESRLISHLQFKNWPNYGVPDAVGPISEFVKLVHQKAENGRFQNPEFVIHCRYVYKVSKKI